MHNSIFGNRQKAIVIGIILIVALLIIISIPMIIKKNNDDARTKRETAGFNDQTDQHSGNVISEGQMEPQQGDIPNAPAVYGLNNLLTRGVDMDDVHIIEPILQSYFAQQANKVKMISITKASDIQHSMDPSSGANLYSASLLIDNKESATLDINIDSNGIASISLTYPSGEVKHLYTRQ